MTAELRLIPPTPRRLKPGAILWQGLPLSLSGLLLTIYGAAATFLLYCVSHSEHQLQDGRLDADGVTATGEVLSVEPIGSSWFARNQQRVRFRFEVAGEPQESVCVVENGAHRVGDPVEIVHLSAAPFEARIVGGKLTTVPDATRAVFAATVLPGLALLVVWAIGTLRLRRVLVHGDASIAEVVGLRAARLPGPTLLIARFRFRDHRARVREGRHWVRARTPLGQRLEAGATRAVVVHDRERPWHHRLVGPEDFEARVTGAPGPAMSPRRP